MMNTRDGGNEFSEFVLKGIGRGVSDKKLKMGFNGFEMMV